MIIEMKVNRYKKKTVSKKKKQIYVICRFVDVIYYLGNYLKNLYI